MASALDLHKLQFVVLVALIILGAGLLSVQVDRGTFPAWLKPLLGIAAIALVVVLAFRFGPLFKAEKKPDQKDVFDYTDRTTSSAVLGKLAEIKYGERKKRDAFENYYKLK